MFDLVSEQCVCVCGGAAAHSMREFALHDRMLATCLHSPLSDSRSEPGKLMDTHTHTQTETHTCSQATFPFISQTNYIVINELHHRAAGLRTTVVCGVQRVCRIEGPSMNVIERRI